MHSIPKTILGFVARIALFVVLAAVSMMGLTLLLLLFAGISSISLSQFGLFPDTPASLTEMNLQQSLVYALIFGLAGIGSLCFAGAVVYYTFHKDKERLDRHLKILGWPMIWISETGVQAFLLQLVVIIIYALWNAPTDHTQWNEETMNLIAHQARFALLAALIYAGIRAADKLSEPSEGQDRSELK
jgi:hypothetical protein